MRTRAKVMIGAAVVLAGARAALPAIIKSRLNARLAAVEGWDARVGDVDLALLRGGLALRKIEATGKGSTFRLAVKRAAVNVGWGELLRRRLVASVDVSRPEVSMTLQPAAKEKAKEAVEKVEKKAGLVWPDLRRVFPFRIERFEVRDGQVLVKEGEQEAKITGLYFVVSGLTNRPKGGESPRAKGEAGATILKEGTARVDFHVDPTQRPPAFDFALAVKKIELPALNPLLRAQFGMDVSKGVFELVAEAESSGGGFRGYVKPFIDELKMGPTAGKGGGAAKVIKEAVVGAGAAVLKNPKTAAVAARVPFEGRYDDPDIGVWQALLSVLRNAFIKALTPTFERRRPS